MRLVSLLAAPFAALSVVLPVPAQRPGPEPAHHLVRVQLRGAADHAKLRRLDLDIASCTGHRAPARELEVIATDRDLRALREAGLEHRVVQRDMEAEAARRLSQWSFPNVLNPPVGQGAMGGHYTLAQILGIVDQLHAQNPKICAAKQSLGKSHENRDIWMVKISDNVQQDENEPEVLFDALHHAREPVSASATLFFMDWLVSGYGKDPEATFLVENRELYFVPCVNPDGYEYNRSIAPQGGGMWRKNRRVNSSTSFGVDLNRNWATGWSAPHGGNSSSPSSDTYRGPSAFSEPEVAALEAFVKTRSFGLACSTHTWSGMVLLHPWGYLPAPNENPPNVADYTRVGALATAANTSMRAGATSTHLYVAAGTATDHCHAAHGMYAYLPELGGGFWPSPPQQVQLVSLHLPMFRALAKAAGASLEPVEPRLTEAAGGNGNRRVDPGERAELRVTLRNDGAVATATSVRGRVVALTAGVTVERAEHDFGRIDKFQSARNDAAPFVLRTDSTFREDQIAVRLELSFDTMVLRHELRVDVATPELLVATDFETPLGFARGAADTATTGLFEIGAPQQTIYQSQVIQPQGDHSPNGTRCWVTDARAGSQAGEFDVDGGKTTLLTPVIDLRHVAVPTVAAWVYYTENEGPQDAFTVEVSSKPNEWTELYRRDTSTGGWLRLVLRLPSPATETMQLRFTAEDLTVSLVELLVDDFEVLGAVDPGALTLFGSGARGTSVRIGLQGAPNAAGVPLLATQTGNLQVPGITGTLWLDLSTLQVLAPIPFGSSAHATFDVAVPNDAKLIGLRLHWQQLLVSSAAFRLGNRSSFEVR